MANWAAGRRGVGPGVKRRVLRIIGRSFAAGGVAAVDHSIHMNVVYVIDEEKEGLRRGFGLRRSGYLSFG
jgi:hypothetical protein